jgi:hypothetical protein
MTPNVKPVFDAEGSAGDLQCCVRPVVNRELSTTWGRTVDDALLRVDGLWTTKPQLVDEVHACNYYM